MLASTPFTSVLLEFAFLVGAFALLVNMLTEYAAYRIDSNLLQRAKLYGSIAFLASFILGSLGTTYIGNGAVRYLPFIGFVIASAAFICWYKCRLLSGLLMKEQEKHSTD